MGGGRGENPGTQGHSAAKIGSRVAGSEALRISDTKNQKGTMKAIRRPISGWTTAASRIMAAIDNASLLRKQKDTIICRNCTLAPTSHAIIASDRRLLAGNATRAQS